MGKWKPKTFKDDGLKDIHCCNCGTYLKYCSRLIDIEIKRIKCKDCGTMNVIYPPRKAEINNEKVIFFRDYQNGRDPMEGTYTADQTQ